MLDTTAFTPAERALLATFTADHNLDLALDRDDGGDRPGSDFAFIGPAPGRAAWAIVREDGRLFVDHLGSDWRAPVRSVEEALEVLEVASGKRRRLLH